MTKEINTDFPFESKFVQINGSKIHYIEEGEGDPILFLHGNPTSSYLWRNIIPYLKNQGKCIAPDLIGMGKSDKPDINYGFFESYDYVEKFIEEKGLKNITLVIHDWGSAIGFHYAKNHPENVKGIAFMESVYRIRAFSEMPKGMILPFKMIRTPFIGWVMICVFNMFVKNILPKAISRKLTEKEKEIYAEPYKTIKSRKPLMVWARNIPFDEKPKDVHDAMSAWEKWLQETNIPKLFLNATPGMVIPDTEEELQKIKKLPNLEIVKIGEGLHFVQEDQPDKIGESISSWYRKINEN